jgi:PAS domain S-box-containing protein
MLAAASSAYTCEDLFRDLTPTARWYILSVIGLGALILALFLQRAMLSPIVPLAFLALVSSLTSAFKVQFPIASGSNMSVSYVVDIAAIILRGPHAAMIVGAVSGWSQSTLNSQARNPLYRTLFNMACLVITIQAAGQVYQLLGGRASGVLTGNLSTIAIATTGMALTYFVVNTVPIAIAIALTTSQSAWRVWKSDFASSASSYLFGALAAVVVIAVTERSGYWLTLLLAAAPLYLTYKMYRTGAEAEARQGAILEAAHDAIITLDSDLNIRVFNPAAEQLFGYSRLSILGKTMDMLLPPAERPAQVAALKRYIARGDGPLARRQVEMTAMREDGTEIPVEITVSRVGSDSRASVTGFVRDIRERRALEERLRQSQKLEAIGRLAGGVAHDFNNILMSIMGSADLLLMDLKPTDPSHSEVTEIKESVRRGAALTRQLLAFSRRQATVPRLFDLGEIIGGMDTMLRRLIGPEIELDVQKPAKPATVRADPAQIEQVVLNLVVNARDAMPEGGRVTVTIEAVDLDDEAASDVDGKPGRYACLSVTDTGTGIDQSTRARLFEPFFTTKEQGKGTGLGLSIVYGIVKQSGGSIVVSSEPGRGATFRIYLPIAAVPESSPVAV